MKTKLHLKGIHKITLARIESEEASNEHAHLRELDSFLRTCEPMKRRTPFYEIMRQEFVEKLRIFNARYGYKTLIIENATCTDGRTRIAKALSGNISATTEIEVNYVAVGTSTTAPASTDTQLGTETFRKAISSMTYSGAIFYGTAFYAAGEGTGTLKEHGLFIEGSATANSGELLSHLSLGSVVKGAGDTLTVETEIQINDA